MIWAVFQVMSLEQVRERAGDKLRELRERRHWSYVFMATEIDALGGHVSAKTIENIEKGATNYEFAALYWCARVLGLTVGELLEFSIESTDTRAHAHLAAVLKMDVQDRNHALSTLRYLFSRSAISKKSPKGA